MTLLSFAKVASDAAGQSASSEHSAAGVVAEAVAAFEIASAMIEKFGGDSLDEMKRNFIGYEKQVKTRMEVEEEQKK